MRIIFPTILCLAISGSISNEEFKQAIKEVLSIVKNYNHEITIIECDKEIKRVLRNLQGVLDDYDRDEPWDVNMD